MARRPRARRAAEDAEVVEGGDAPALEAQAAALGPDGPEPAVEDARTVRGERAWPATKIEMLPISELNPHAQNPRNHTPKQVEAIALSIEKFGFTIPVLIDEKNELIAGHGRLMAAERLGLSRIPTMRAKGWTEDEKRAYRIADNRLTELSSFDESLLRAEVEKLEAAGFDLSLTGFDEGQLERLFKEDDDIPILELPTDMPLDRFWITIRGPLARQAEALERLKAVMGELGDIDVRLGTIQRDSGS
ncbi:MAG: ParB/Srx family N-terminal domain-containing protein [Pikeienuella sp.]|uniref:ParB/Srx family N-terminal domain-containing protein n=1 Tax=Pikeienuella sp. TaxID=2831957 RepID=UPI0039197570